MRIYSSARDLLFPLTFLIKNYGSKDVQELATSMLSVVIISIALSISLVNCVTTIEGPLPTKKVAPINSTVQFMCVTNNTSPPDPSNPPVGVIWRLNNIIILGDVETTIGGGILSILSVLVKDGYSNELVQCGVSFVITIPVFSSTNATLTAYGKFDRWSMVGNE